MVLLMSTCQRHAVSEASFSLIRFTAESWRDCTRVDRQYPCFGRKRSFKNGLPRRISHAIKDRHHATVSDLHYCRAIFCKGFSEFCVLIHVRARSARMSAWAACCERNGVTDSKQSRLYRSIRNGCKKVGQWMLSRHAKMEQSYERQTRAVDEHNTI